MFILLIELLYVTIIKAAIRKKSATVHIKNIIGFTFSSIFLFHEEIKKIFYLRLGDLRLGDFLGDLRFRDLDLHLGGDFRLGGDLRLGDFDFRLGGDFRLGDVEKLIVGDSDSDAYILLAFKGPGVSNM